QRRTLSINGDRGLERAEVPREVEMLIRREMLIGKDQDCVLREGVFDRLHIRGVDWPSQVDVADFGRKAWRDRINGDGHGHVLGARGFAGVAGIESWRTKACNRLGSDFKPGRPGASNGKRVSSRARSAQRVGPFRRPASRAAPGGN